MEQNKNVATVADYTDDERDALNVKIDEQYRKIITEGKYKDLLVKCGANSRYSVSNIMLMLTQNPDMTVARSMNEWANEGRHIKESAANMEIIAPTKEEYEVTVKDENGEPKLDEDGNEIVRKRERTVGFHPVYVFDISATEGAEHKPYAIGKKISDTEKRNILDGIFSALSAKHWKYKFTDESEFAADENYKIDKEKKTVKICKGLGNKETALTAIEAASKAINDNYKGRGFEGMTGENAEKIEADSRACILAAHFGLDTSGFNFDYMQKMNEEQTGLFRDNLNLICARSKLVMDKISRAFYKDQQARAQAAPDPTAVGGGGDEEFSDDSFREEFVKHSEMEAA
ncbi:MAG: hypothetical protein OSJ74_07900 [Clostridia bacterium]|nr:hypothetical protein [Clostridia bacterium]